MYKHCILEYFSNVSVFPNQLPLRRSENKPCERRAVFGANMMHSSRKGTGICSEERIPCRAGNAGVALMSMF